jgi:hypothetical protein
MLGRVTLSRSGGSQLPLAKMSTSLNTLPFPLEPDTLAGDEKNPPLPGRFLSCRAQAAARARPRKPGPAASTGSLEALQPASLNSRQGPPVLGRALPALGAWARGLDRCETGDGFGRHRRGFRLSWSWRSETACDRLLNGAAADLHLFDGMRRDQQ